MRIAMLAPKGRRTSTHHTDRRERLVHLLAEGLRSRNVDVTVFSTLDVEAVRGSFADSKDRPECVGPASEVAESLELCEFFEQSSDYDLIHNHAGCLPLIYSRPLNKPFLTTFHGMPSSEIMPAYRKFNGKTFYISLSDADRSPNLSYLQTVYPGLDLGAFTFSREYDPYLVYVGSTMPGNGIRRAMEISRLSNMQLVVAEEIFRDPRVETDLKLFSNDSNIRYVPYGHSERRDAILSRAAAVLKMNCCSASFPLDVVEANACGTPVIAFPSGPLPELIIDGVNGFLVSDIAGAVKAVNMLKTLSRVQCRQTAEERFSQERMVGDYLKVYESILEKTASEDHRPWGYYVVLSDLEDHKVKRIVVYPGKRLSLQRHHRRAEHWTIISGSPIVTRNQREVQLHPGESIDIPLGAVHRVFNPGKEPVVFIEVQMGDYFGEDDIERFEDDFGRV